MLTRRNIVVGALIGTVGVTVPVAIAAEGGGGTPANKAVAAGSKAEVIAPNTNKPIMSATFKTSKPTDLLIGVSLECAILTDVVINGGPDVPTETASAEGTVRVWAELDGKIVPIEDVSAPPQDPAQSGTGDETDKVTFCDRLHQRTITDAEEDPDGIDKSRDYQRSKSANAFNWVRLNAGSGMHTLVIKADLTTTAVGEGSKAEAIIGNRTLVVEPTKLANSAVIAENGTSTSGN
jgi:hypothetical protein